MSGELVRVQAKGTKRDGSECRAFSIINTLARLAFEYEPEQWVRIAYAEPIEQWFLEAECGRIRRFGVLRWYLSLDDESRDWVATQIEHCEDDE